MRGTTIVAGMLLLRLCGIPSAFWDDQRQAGNFLGRYVLITGTFDGLTGTIRVRSIAVATPDEISAMNAEKMKQNSESAKSAMVPITSVPATPVAPQQNELAPPATPRLDARMRTESETPHPARTETSPGPGREDAFRNSFLHLPEEAVSASSTVAISSRRSVPMPANSAKEQSEKNLVIGRLLKRVSPSYPVDAKEQRIEGTVRLHAVIGEDGSIQRVQLVSGAESLVAAALTAVREWRYGPTIPEGHRIQVEDDIMLVFRLPN
jgi:TonB family protein